MAVGYSTTQRNARLDALTTALGASPLLRIYDGARPATGGTATNLLAQLTCAATFAPAASGGVLTANAISSATATGTGSATWARLVTSGGTFVADMSVTLTGGGGDLQITGTTSITSGVTVSVSSLTITEGNP